MECFLQFHISVCEIYAMVEPAVITESENEERKKKTIKYFYSACERDCGNLDLIMQRLFAFIVLFIQLREELLCANTFFFFSSLGSVLEK